VLFPGEDPTPAVEKVAATFDITEANKRFTNISGLRARGNRRDDFEDRRRKGQLGDAAERALDGQLAQEA
jgi:hypothetical protein